MNYFKKIDHYLLLNHPILWRTKAHYFVLFSLILGNIGIVIVSNLFLKLGIDIGYVCILGTVLLTFATLIWAVSQSIIKIKTYRFWDEVKTFGVYIFCAILLYINLVVLIGFPFVDKFFMRWSMWIIFFSVFFVSTSVYAIAHTNLLIVPATLLLHIVLFPLYFLTQGILHFAILFLFIPILIFTPENGRGYKLARFFAIPYIPLGVLAAATILFINFNWSPIFWYPVFFIAIVLTVLLGALLVKGNFRPV